MIGPLELINHSCNSPFAFQMRKQNTEFSKVSDVIHFFTHSFVSKYYKDGLVNMDVVLTKDHDAEEVTIKKGKEFQVNYFPRSTADSKPFVCVCGSCVLK
jgi:hypothetical protein